MKQFLQALVKKEIKLSVDKQGKLLVRGNLKALSQAEKEYIKDNKQEIVAVLSASNVDVSKKPQVKNYQLDQISEHLSFSQSRLWFIDKLNQGSSEYNMPLAFKVSGQLNPKLIDEALKVIVDRHQVLRTTFIESEGQPKASINALPNSILNHQIIQTELSIEEEINQLAIADAEHKFDLSADLMLRASYFEIHTSDDKRTDILLFNMHHIASDGWSMEVLSHEFFHLYDALEQKVEPNLESLAIQYQDYAHWQQAELKETLEGQLDYWEGHLEGAPECHQLPVDYKRPNQKQYKGGVVQSILPADIGKQLIGLSKSVQLTPFMILHALLSLVLSRHSGTNDIVIGSPSANRQQPEIASLIGFFVNTLVFRTDTNHKNIGELFKHIKQCHIDAQANQDTPFDQLVDRLSLERSNAYSPLFQILLTTNSDFSKKDNSVSNEAIQLGDALLYPLEESVVSTKFDLDIHLAMTEEGVSLSWTYDKALFKHETVNRLNQHLINVIEHISELSRLDPSSILEFKLSDISMLSDEEKQEIESQSVSHVDKVKNSHIHDYLELAASKFPQNIAIKHGEEVITFKKLNERANQLAAFLVNEKQLKVGDVIALCFERSVDLIMSIFGVLKAGGVYLPLDLNAPQTRNEFIINDSGATTLLTNLKSKSVASLVGSKTQLIDLECIDLNGLNTFSVDGLAEEAYVLYTSGTTGLPKGVMQRHKTITNLIQHQLEVDGMVGQYNTLQFTPITFDVSIQEITTAIATGSCLTLMSQEQKEALNELHHFIGKHDIERLFIPPAVFDLFAEQINSNKTFIKVKEIVVAGDALKLTDDIVEFLGTHKNVDLYNHYGPTETHVVTSYQVDITQLSKDEITNFNYIGQPVLNTKAIILDKSLSPVPQGCIGELYIQGEGLAKGYINNLELTKKQFIENEVLGKRAYKTGDLVRLDKNGSLSFLGRSDEQIKLRGFRIEPLEVAGQIELLNEVDSALVDVVNTESGKQLIAFVKPCLTCDTAEEALESLILESLSQSMPSYMLPNAVLTVSKWPLTRNGKVDKKALPSPDISANNEIIKPKNDIESCLLNIWAELLKLEKAFISTDANFFKLGGHSLLSVRLVSEVRAKLGREVSVKTIFDNVTIQALAKYLEKQAEPSHSLSIEKLPREKNTPIPLSFAQQRLWFIDQMMSGSPQYNMPMAFEIEGQLDSKVAEKTLSSIVERHEVLRTVYQSTEDGAVQVIRSNSQVIIEQQDLRLLKFEQKHVQLTALMQAEASYIFDLSNELMLKATYVQFEDEFGYLLLNMHHIASDGWSLNIFQREFFELYDTYSQKRIPTLPDLTIQYADFAIWQNTSLTADKLAEQVDYWKTKLDKAPPLHDLTLDFARPAEKQFSGALYSDKLPSGQLAKFDEVAQHYGMTPFMFAHAALSMVISKFSNTTDIVIGTPVANRLQKEVENLIGFFVNVIPLRTEIEKETLSQYLEHVRETHLEAQSNQDIPFEQLVDLLDLPRSESYSPLCQIMMSFNSGQLNTDVSVSELEQLKIKPHQSDECVAKFDLEVEFVSVEGDGLYINWIYDTALFSASTIQAYSESLVETLVSMLSFKKGSHTLLKDVNILSQKAQNQLLLEFNDNLVAYDQSLCIHELFEQQVADNPNQLAVKFKQDTLTYAELNAKANQLAHYLRSQRKIEAETLVGLSIERSIDMIVATLATLKAGAAYVPLDPTYPKSRLDYMIEDSGISIVVTQSHVLESVDFGQATSVIIDGLCDSSNSIYDSYSTDNLDKEQLGVTARSLAYEIYTSGSTGKPKGVLLEHQGIINLAHNQRSAFAVEQNSRVLHFASMSFDAGTWEYAMALLNGATLIIADGDTRLSPEALSSLLFEEKVTHATLPPAFLNMMSLRTDLSLHALIVAGEACEPELVNLWSEHYGFFNAYGPTESSVCASYQKLEPNQAITIGKPLNNISLLILDDKQSLLPVGVVGELCIGGDGLARGYHGKVELTEEKFIDNPYYQSKLGPHSSNSPKLYRTGDLARFLEDGSIDFVGRLDAQIKIRGFRVELSEIENQLAQCPGVEAALVLDKVGPMGNKVLVAYVSFVMSPEDSQTQDKLATLKAALKAQLPDYMVPSLFIEIIEWPLTHNGKIDKKALPEPDMSNMQQAYVAPQTQTESDLVEIWGQLLNLDSALIGIHADFFEVGGNSILVTRLETAIRAAYSVEFSIKDLFSITDLKGQALHIDFLLSQQNSHQELDEELEDLEW